MGHDAKLRVEKGHNESSVSEHFDVIEVVYNLPLYILRKLIYIFCLILLHTVNKLSYLFGFHFAYSLSDKERWNWLSNVKLPRYGVIRKDG